MRHLLVLCVGLIMGAMPVHADDQTLTRGQAEMQRAIVSLGPRQSLDTTPVEFSVGGINYRMPRNYLETMSNWAGGPQALVTVRVNLPDMEPIKAESQDCFMIGSLAGSPGCDPLSFVINAPGGVSADEVFVNIQGSFHSQEPIEGPFGYEKYETGPENFRRETYKKLYGTRTLLYSCHIFDNRGKRDGLCDPIDDRLSTGAVLHFFFNLRLLADIDHIDANLRKLIERFTIQ